MKKLMQTSLAAMLLAGVALTASAQELGMGQKSMALGQKIGQEVMEEVKAAGKPTPEAVGKKMVEKLRANLEEMKKAGVEDCTTLYGADKASNCQCVTDKTDYEAMFSLMEKQMANPQTQHTDAINALKSQAEENYKACELDIKVIQEAAEKAMKAATEKKG
mgnify:FL=1